MKGRTLPNDLLFCKKRRLKTALKYLKRGPQRGAVFVWLKLYIILSLMVTTMPVSTSLSNSAVSGKSMPLQNVVANGISTGVASGLGRRGAKRFQNFTSRLRNASGSWNCEELAFSWVQPGANIATDMSRQQHTKRKKDHAIFEGRENLPTAAIMIMFPPIFHERDSKN